MCEINLNHVCTNIINNVLREKTNNMHSEREGMAVMSKEVRHAVPFSINVSQSPSNSDGEVDVVLIYSQNATSLHYVSFEYKLQPRLNQVVGSPYDILNPMHTVVQG